MRIYNYKLILILTIIFFAIPKTFELNITLYIELQYLVKVLEWFWEIGSEKINVLHCALWLAPHCFACTLDIYNYKCLKIDYSNIIMYFLYFCKVLYRYIGLSECFIDIFSDFDAK